MATTPNYSTIIANIRTALLEIEATVVSCDAVPYSFHRQGLFPFWTNAINVANFAKRADKFMTCTLQVQVVHHVGLMTGGLDGELEKSAQELALELPLAFIERPRLKCASFPTHVDGIEPMGLTVTSCNLANVSFNGSETTRAVVCELAIPILFLVNIK